MAKAIGEGQKEGGFTEYRRKWATRGVLAGTEGTVITRLRYGHTGLNKRLLVCYWQVTTAMCRHVHGVV